MKVNYSYFVLKHTDSIDNIKCYIYCLWQIDKQVKKRNNVAMNLFCSLFYLLSSC